MRPSIFNPQTFSYNPYAFLRKNLYNPDLTSLPRMDISHFMGFSRSPAVTATPAKTAVQSSGTGLDAHTIGRVGMGVAAASTIGSIFEQEMGTNAQMSALEDEQLQNQMEGSQQIIDRNKELMQVVGATVTMASARGIDLGSGTYKAVQEKSISNAQDANRITQLNVDIKNRKINEEMDALYAKESANIFNSFLQMGANLGMLIAM